MLRIVCREAASFFVSGLGMDNCPCKMPGTFFLSPEPNGLFPCYILFLISRGQRDSEHGPAGFLTSKDP